MFRNKSNRIFLIFFVVIVLVSFYSLSFEKMINVPEEIKIFEDEKQSFNVRFPFKVDHTKIDTNILKLSPKTDNDEKMLYLNPVNIGKTNIQVKLLGIIPFGSVKVDVVPKTKMIPGGQSVGVRLNTKGVLVVGLEKIKGIDSKYHNPAQEAGITVGDSILQINHIQIKDADHVTKIINENKNNQLNLKVKRRNEVFHVDIMPIQSVEDEEYKIGVWVRDKTAGIGTLTFYHPATNKFGALGHAITDVDTGLLLTVDNGQIVKSKVASIEQGKKGKPGEIKGIFYETSNPIGNLKKNTNFGIYGEAYDPLIHELYQEPIDIGYQYQVKEGKATILTTIDNNQVEAFEIYIEKVNRQRTPNTKSMVIKVTDPRLLKKSGGIVQGMSGSPIIQNNKLIGAVTHVFVNDPSKGYGLFIEWMMQEGGIDLLENNQIANDYSLAK
ncbi:SpoIVB peptidase [Anaerophilus nitritogenes]|uniref:SpoIVB peptidase n=1 Tax=Anaerophilus nitritogenes TaxID=2498136 RepID=UPI00101C5A73|nr:SpoIVB peptidase [Anaerophilus nitritogenes]